MLQVYHHPMTPCDALLLLGYSRMAGCLLSFQHTYRICVLIAFRVSWFRRVWSKTSSYKFQRSSFTLDTYICNINISSIYTHNNSVYSNENFERHWQEISQLKIRQWSILIYHRLQQWSEMAGTAIRVLFLCTKNYLKLKLCPSTLMPCTKSPSNM